MVTLRVTTESGESKDYPIADILSALGVTEPVREVSFDLVNNGRRLTASVDDNEDYPGMFMDAIDGDGNLLYLANAELPNELYPESIAARLYAGYAGKEYDGPIAIVKHAITASDNREEKKMPHKYVFVDMDYAAVRDYEGVVSAPEHVED